MSDQPANLRSLFDAASELPPEAQEAWLEQHCADPALRERVRRLLRAQMRTQDPLAIAPQERLAAIDIPKPALGERRRIADFTLIRPVGHGGMATVYLAERSGFAQRVAIKLLHRTLLSDLDRKLFERERKVLASLEHPSIARLIDGGVTELREPYLVMEYVEGLPITEYARQRALAPAAQVALLIDVCDAVATAHAQLIVHRDLKPSNVLINAEGRVKLLDFGVAKVLADDAELTREGVAGFTPDYAAPEQIGDGVISTATDVYALGVMALELLIGSKRAALRKLKPSQAVLLPDDEGTTLALTQRGLAHFLRGDLDNVLQKCLEEDPQRRYQGAAALAEDLRRFAPPASQRASALALVSGAQIRAAPSRWRHPHGLVDAGHADLAGAGAALGARGAHAGRTRRAACDRRRAGAGARRNRAAGLANGARLSDRHVRRSRA